MEKITKFFIFFPIFVLFLVPSLSQAEVPILTASHITVTAVTLIATGLTPNQYYKFKFVVPVSTLQSQVISDTTGDASSSFAKLNPNTTYTVSLLTYDPITGVEASSGAPDLSFKTAKDAKTPGYVFPIIDETFGLGAPEPIDVIGGGPIPIHKPITLDKTPIPTSSQNNPVYTPAPTPAPAPTQDTTSPSSAPSNGLVPCTNTPTMVNGIVSKNSDGTIAYTSKCDFNALMNLINIVIHFILFDLALPIAAIMFAYAGFELVTSGGSTEKRGTAKKVFTNTALGFVLAIAGWLIIRTVLTILGYDGTWIGF
jgi:hypothetical protein